jgi:hypothetical protein
MLGRHKKIEIAQLIIALNGLQVSILNLLSEKQRDMSRKQYRVSI